MHIPQKAPETESGTSSHEVTSQNTKTAVPSELAFFFGLVSTYSSLLERLHSFMKS